MFTEYDKAIVAVITGVLSIISLWLGWDLSPLADEKVVTGLAILTPILVWLVPNKLKPKP